jgi:hypothetical protein
MPPVSVTMQARNFPVVDAPADGVLDELLDGVLDDDDPLEPHAAASKATTLRPAAILTVPLTVPPLQGRPCSRLEASPAQSVAPAGWGTKSPGNHPPGCPKGIPGDAILEGGNRPLAALLRNRDR